MCSGWRRRCHRAPTSRVSSSSSTVSHARPESSSARSRPGSPFSTPPARPLFRSSSRPRAPSARSRASSGARAEPCASAGQGTRDPSTLHGPVGGDRRVEREEVPVHRRDHHHECIRLRRPDRPRDAAARGRRGGRRDVQRDGSGSDCATAEARAARERKQKIFVLVGGLALVGLLALQLPKLLGGTASPEAAATSTTESAALGRRPPRARLRSQSWACRWRAASSPRSPPSRPRIHSCSRSTRAGRRGHGDRW